MNYTIEIATTDFISTKNAVEGGADRIELCAALSDGGTTPSAGTIKLCRERFDTELFPIIRPRSGDFLYTDDEFLIMMHDVLLSKQLGCDGIVTGLLKTNGSIDKKRTSILIELAYPMEVTFHRAFDRAKDPFLALEELIEIGCTRILTSGQQVNAEDGINLIRQLVELAGERISIMPGSGVRKENIRSLAERTGAREFHSSLRASNASEMKFMHPSFENQAGNYNNPGIVPGEVLALRKELENT